MSEYEQALVEIVLCNLNQPPIFTDMFYEALEIMRADFNEYVLYGDVSVSGLKAWQEATRP